MGWLEGQQDHSQVPCSCAERRSPEAVTSTVSLASTALVPRRAAMPFVLTLSGTPILLTATLSKLPSARACTPSSTQSLVPPPTVLSTPARSPSSATTRPTASGRTARRMTTPLMCLSAASAATLRFSQPSLCPVSLPLTATTSTVATLASLGATLVPPPLSPAVATMASGLPTLVPPAALSSSSSAT